MEIVLGAMKIHQLFNPSTSIKKVSFPSSDEKDGSVYIFFLPLFLDPIAEGNKELNSTLSVCSS